MKKSNDVIIKLYGIAFLVREGDELYFEPTLSGKGFQICQKRNKEIIRISSIVRCK